MEDGLLPGSQPGPPRYGSACRPGLPTSLPEVWLNPAGVSACLPKSLLHFFFFLEKMTKKNNPAGHQGPTQAFSPQGQDRTDKGLSWVPMWLLYRARLAEFSGSPGWGGDFPAQQATGMTQGWLPVGACALGPPHLWRGPAESGSSVPGWRRPCKHGVSNTYVP